MQGGHTVVTERERARERHGDRWEGHGWAMDMVMVQLYIHMERRGEGRHEGRPRKHFFWHAKTETQEEGDVLSAVCCAFLHSLSHTNELTWRRHALAQSDTSTTTLVY